MYKIEMQFVPNLDNIWVYKLNMEDPIYEYDTESEAKQKAQQLEKADGTGRKYRVVSA